MLMTIVTSHDWSGLHYENDRREVWVDEEPYAANDLLVHEFLQAKIHGQDLVSLQASNSSLSQRPNKELLNHESQLFTKFFY